MNIRNVTEKDLIRALSTPCATLDKKGTVPDAQVAGQVTDVLEFATRAGFPAEGSKGKFYVDKETGKAYEWSGTEYVESPGAPEFIRRMGVDLSQKADKVANATPGNLAALDDNGNLTDSGMTLRDFAVAKSLAPAYVPYKAYEVGDLCTSFDNDEQHKGTWLYKCILAPDPLQPPMPPEIDPTHWAPATVEDVLAALRTAVANKVGSFASVGGATATVENGVAKLDDFFKESTSYTGDLPTPTGKLKNTKLDQAVQIVLNEKGGDDEKTQAVFSTFARMDDFATDSDESDSFDIAITKLSQLIGEDVAA